MAWYPRARRRPISRNYTRRRTAKNCVLWHTTASAAATSMFGWFNTRNANASSHFHVDNAGNVEQYIDTAHISWANRDGNARSVTIETQGTGSEPWTAAQRRAIVDLTRWICQTHGIPVRQMASSHASQSGIGWHRLGINGNFPRTGILRGRQQRGGGQLWSGARGKTCPGTQRIQQIPAMIQQIAGGRSSTTSTPTAGDYGTAGGGGTTMRYEWYEVTAPYVNIRTGPSTGHRIVRRARRGERVLVRGNPNAAWVLVGASLRMNRRAAKLRKVDGPSDASKLTHGQWPDRLIPRIGRHTSESDRAWRDLLSRLGHNHSSIVRNFQTWLNSRGHNLVVDGIRGPRTNRALQQQVGARVDGIRGQETINRELIYLNNQRAHLTPRPPSATRKYRAYQG